MLYNLINKLDEKLSFSTVSAQCDIPCKSYVPISAQHAALTVVCMVDSLNERNEKNLKQTGQFVSTRQSKQ